MLQCLSPLPSKIVWPQRISTNPRIYVNCGCIYSRISSYFTALKFLKWLQSQKWWHLPSQSFSQIQKSVESTGPDWEFFSPDGLSTNATPLHKISGMRYIPVGLPKVKLAFTRPTNLSIMDSKSNSENVMRRNLEAEIH